MISKTKIGIGTLIVASFIVGGIAFNTFQADAFGGGRMFGFFRSSEQCNLTRLEKGSEEWQAKMEECKAERETQREEWKNMSEEERQAKMEEMKANRPELTEEMKAKMEEFKNSGQWKGKIGRPFGPMGLMGFSDEVNREVVNLENGVQITITSDNSEIVQKLKDAAAEISNGSGE